MTWIGTENKYQTIESQETRGNMLTFRKQPAAMCKSISTCLLVNGGLLLQNTKMLCRVGWLVKANKLFKTSCNTVKHINNNDYIFISKLSNVWLPIEPSLHHKPETSGLWFLTEESRHETERLFRSRLHSQINEKLDVKMAGSVFQLEQPPVHLLSCS